MHLCGMKKDYKTNILKSYFMFDKNNMCFYNKNVLGSSIFFVGGW
jgi:hypothetical protein